MLPVEKVRTCKIPAVLGVFRAAAIALAIGLFLLTVAGACGETEVQDVVVRPTTSATATPSPLTLPAETSVTFCLDASISMPPPLRDAAREAFSDQLAGLVVPGFPGMRLTMHWMIHHTSPLDTAIGTYTIPAVRLEPLKPPYPDEPEAPDPLDPLYIFDPAGYREAVAQFEDDLEAWQERVDDIDDAHDLAVEDSVADLEAALLVVTNVKRVLLAAVPPETDGGSDQGNCISKAVAFSQRAERAELVLATDGQAVGKQNLGSDPSLAGIDVDVIFFFCEEVTDCEEAQRDWADLFATADDVDFYDPDEDISLILID